MNDYAEQAVVQENESENEGLFFKTPQDFFDRFLSLIYFRKKSTHDSRWCEYWWKHPEAYFRVMTMWRSYEQMRADEPMTGVANWMVHIGDPMMRALMDEQGTFVHCKNAHTVCEGSEARLPHAPYGAQ